MLVKQIIYFGMPCSLACDGKCEKAWGTTYRPINQLSDNIDDYEILSDSELGIAPEDPGTYEGGHAKPTSDEEKLNKWCARECERSRMVGGEDGVVELPRFDKRRKNIK